MSESGLLLPNRSASLKKKAPQASRPIRSAAPMLTPKPSFRHLSSFITRGKGAATSREIEVRRSSGAGTDCGEGGNGFSLDLGEAGVVAGNMALDAADTYGDDGNGLSLELGEADVSTGKMASQSTDTYSDMVEDVVANSIENTTIDDVVDDSLELTWNDAMHTAKLVENSLDSIRNEALQTAKVAEMLGIGFEEDSNTVMEHILCLERGDVGA